MEGKEEKTVYPCIWYEDIAECPIRTMWKLKPESIVAFCAICPKKIRKDRLGV